jgi:hypothetical protein
MNESQKVGARRVAVFVGTATLVLNMITKSKDGYMRFLLLERSREAVALVTIVQQSGGGFNKPNLENGWLHDFRDVCINKRWMIGQCGCYDSCRRPCSIFVYKSTPSSTPYFELIYRYLPARLSLSLFER